MKAYPPALPSVVVVEKGGKAVTNTHVLNRESYQGWGGFAPLEDLCVSVQDTRCSHKEHGGGRVFCYVFAWHIYHIYTVCVSDCHLRSPHRLVS